MRAPGTRIVAALLAGAGAILAGTAHAGPPEPSGPHPRLWLDASTRTSMKALATEDGSGVARAIRECKRVGGALAEESRNVYMAFEWAAHASNCAIAYQATGDAAHARVALRFFAALLDDWGHVGDGKGGDTAARHDSGYAIRSVGVHAAIAYDFLHDAPGMTPELLAKARARFKAWTDWYYAHGYRAKSPGTNYHAGYVLAVTLIAIAQGGEAGSDGAKLWHHTTEQVWGRDMKSASAPTGLLDGGDWAEGWQYGPLAVASYALAARAMLQRGATWPELRTWAEQVVLRHIHALSPGDAGVFVGGDTQSEAPSVPPNRWTLAGVIAGPSSDMAAGWARAEIHRLRLRDDDRSFLIFDALADARRIEATPPPRESTPTLYLAKGNGALYARSTWSRAAAWMAMQCTRSLEVDHLPPNAGNFVLTRGSDELVVDPSPYGSLSSLTSNAPTVDSAQLPASYRPSQGVWSEKTGYAWARQTESAIVVARCDYADQYKFQDRASDVPMALRDLVLVPSHDGNATAVVVDRARTGSAGGALHLRFRTKANLTLGPGGAQGTVGRSTLKISPVFTSSGSPSVRRTGKGDCFGKANTRGNCTAARFPVDDYVVTVAGEEASAVHVLDIAGRYESLAPARMTSEPDHRIVSFERGARRASIVIAASGDRPRLTYRAPPGHHVVLDAPGSRNRDGRAQVTASRDGALCAVTVTAAASGGVDARPVAISLTDACAVAEDVTQSRPAPSSLDDSEASRRGAGQPDPEARVASPFDGDPVAAGVPRARPARGCGCAGTGVGAGAAGHALVFFAIAALVVRRRHLRRDAS